MDPDCPSFILTLPLSFATTVRLREEAKDIVTAGPYRLTNTFPIGEVPAGCIWVVRIERQWCPLVRSRRFFLTKGWRMFAGDMQLRPGDMLVFKLVAPREFRVEVFNDFGFRKQALGLLTESSDEDLHSSSSEDSDSTGDGGHEHSPMEEEGEAAGQGGEVEEEEHGQGPEVKFVLVMNASSFNKCNIPIEFAVNSGVKDLPSVELLLPAVTNRSWQVTVHERLATSNSKILKSGRSPSHRYELTGGWKQFCRDNRIVVDDKVIFTYVGNGRIFVRIERVDGTMDG